MDDRTLDTPPECFDVAIVGGGMVGASLAVALGDTGLRITLIEGFAHDASAQPSFDDRTTAIGNGSRAIFESLGVWDAMRADAAPIRAIHVSDAGRMGFARLVAAEQDLEAFGYVIPNRTIGRALWAALRDQANLSLHVPARVTAVKVEATHVLLTVAASGATATGGAVAARDASAMGSAPPLTLRARLLVAADGAHSTLRQELGLAAHVEDYEQVAVVVNVAADRPHEGIAYERFTSSGPIAVLPLADGSYTVVWAVRPDAADAMLARDDASFLRNLQAAFGWRAGKLVRAGRRSTYPLALTRADRSIAARAVLIGNAAQALHPVAGQGFNLGLRDAAALAETLADAANLSDAAHLAVAANLAGPADSATAADVGAPAILERFATWRADDRSGVTRFTDQLVKLFADRRRGAGLARDAGLLLFDILPPAKRALSRVSWGFGAKLPRLSRGLALRRSPARARDAKP